MLVLAVVLAARGNGRASSPLTAVSFVGLRVMPAAAAAATVGLVSMASMYACGLVVRHPGRRMRAS
jgi:uncharacterized protein involved in cysteine biosynthesis